MEEEPEGDEFQSRIEGERGRWWVGIVTGDYRSGVN